MYKKYNYIIGGHRSGVVRRLIVNIAVVGLISNGNKELFIYFPAPLTSV